MHVLKNENVNGVIRERRYPISTNTTFDNLLFPWDNFQTCLQTKNNKSTPKFSTTTFFSLRISTGNCMSMTVSKSEMGPIFVEWAIFACAQFVVTCTRWEKDFLVQSPLRFFNPTHFAHSTNIMLIATNSEKISKKKKNVWHRNSKNWIKTWNETRDNTNFLTILMSC